MTVHGNIAGLKSAQKKALERLSLRKMPTQKIVSVEVAQTLAMLSKEIGRQIGVFIDRGGQIVDVAVGDASKIMLPDFGRIRAGERRFRGLRFVHSHLKQEPLSRDDMTDLSKLRLDMIVAIGVLPDGLPGSIYLAHLLPPSKKGGLHRQMGPLNIGMLPEDFIELIESLEDEFKRHTATRKVDMPQGRAVVVHVTSDRKKLLEAQRALDELVELANTAGVEVVDRVIQIRKKADPLYIMGRGKLEEVTIRAMQQDAELLIIDCNLGANQSRAIAEMTDMKVIDRTQLILDIFSQRANSADGKLKVELAQLKYLLPRLGAKDDALSRLTGGIGGRGPGETKLEIGKRRARDRITKLQKKLGQLKKGRQQRRVQRQRNNVPIVSIVGYTNAGKSTLLNTLTRSDVFVEDRLFATLDTSSRRLRFPREREVIITDTVGFIRDLPKDLVDAFEATLEELNDASLLLHVVDVADPMRKEQICWVEKILMDLGLEDTPRLLVYNKADKINIEDIQSEVELSQGVITSAIDRHSLHSLLGRIERFLWNRN